MRDAEIIETELMEISVIIDDTIKLERIVAWCASHPDEVPFALQSPLVPPTQGSFAKLIGVTAHRVGAPFYGTSTCRQALSRGNHRGTLEQNRLYSAPYLARSIGSSYPSTKR